MLKKLSCLLVLMVGLAMGSVCFAHSMPIEEFAVGNVRQGQTFSEAIALVGEPSSKSENYIGDFSMYAVTYMFANGMTIDGWTPNANASPSDIKVRRIVCTTGNYATPSGFRVGDSYNAVAQRFGVGDTAPSSEANHTYYCYSIGGKQIAFLVDSQRKITKITIAAEV